MTSASSTEPTVHGAPTAVFSALRIAELLAEPPKPVLAPTDEQQAVIEHPLTGSALVIAGAGSGKTETMANRVVWLVANGIVAPDQVLGLTFTRKAAGELRERITGRLHTFGHRLTDAAERGRLGPLEAARAAELNELLADGLELPEVSTYNSFAAGLLQEYGIAAGIPLGAAIIDEATAWRIGRDVVLRSEDPELATSELSIAKLVQHTISLDHAVADHLTSLERVDQVVAEFVRVVDLPYNEKKPEGKVYAAIREAVANQHEMRIITRLAREFAAEKRRRGLMEFSDQLALAMRALERSPNAISLLRRRHRAVLLDEVQDTSVAQTRLLSMIFAGAPVMAVGDPHQSIYGWRGASAEGLRSFHADFRARSGSEGTNPAAPSSATPSSATLTLSISWRNPAAVLDAANALSSPLRAGSAIDVPELRPRPGASTGRIEWCYPETVHEERRRVAEWMRDARAAHLAEHGEEPSAAVILRTRRHMARFSAALTEAGVPNRIVGLGGLLGTPEITDIVSALRCIWYADAGGDLIRLLAGPRFRLGVADLAGLRSAARWFSERDIAQQRLSPEDRDADRVLPDPDREFTLIDALDQLAVTKDRDHPALARLTDAGLDRLRDAGEMLAALRRGVGGDIIELIGAVVRALRIDIELEANEVHAHGGSAAALANIDAFTALVEDFIATDTLGTLPSLLDWIERATEADEVAEHVPAPVPGTVQLITAHGAKGLEWDIVAVPRLVEGEFPGRPREGTGWLRTGRLPDELRGDAASRPQLNWRIASTQKELRDRLTDYADELKEYAATEERRVGYVAITRSASRLLLSGSFWGGQKNARPPSEYLLELEERGLLAGLPTASEYDSDPSEHEEFAAQWPLDPLGHRAEAVFRAADAVRLTLDEYEPESQPGDPVVRLLLAEREAQRRRELPSAPPPTRITASTFHEFIEDPEAAERHRLRPVPGRPFRRTRVGNRFHEWVERRATTAIGTALPLFGFDPEEWDPGRADLDLERELEPLIENFERSRWADRQPIAVELEVTLPFAGRRLVCKLDAIYREGEGDAARYEIVDWKSGRMPTSTAERESRFLQLDLYRHAYARWADIDPRAIDVSLFYVAEGQELRGEGTRSLDELEALWIAAAERASAG
ncbi:MAG: ATP-dependent helicase [Leucobacter sp.]|nr:ATP-dependent helicase [Leucobacter sp.]